MTGNAGRHLLLVHAHPDDESIGQGATMARYVAEGVGVTLVTCTGGEMGEILVPELEHLAADQDDTLADQRRIELDKAMAELGVTDHRYLGGFKRYRDSGMQWHADGHAVAADDVHDNAFWNADLTEAANDLVQVIREVQPQVLVTYDEFGGYGHPDHIQAHRVAMYGAVLAAVPSYRRDLGEAWDVAKIYWGAMSASRFRDGIRRLREAGDTTSFEGMDPDNLPAFAIEDDDLSAAIDGSAVRRAEDGRAPGARDPDRRRRAVLRAEQQHRQRGLGHRVLPAGQGQAGPGRRARAGDGPVRRRLSPRFAAVCGGRLPTIGP